MVPYQIIIDRKIECSVCATHSRMSLIHYCWSVMYV